MPPPAPGEEPRRRGACTGRSCAPRNLALKGSRPRQSAVEKFQALQRVYSVLGDPEKRCVRAREFTSSVALKCVAGPAGRCMTRRALTTWCVRRASAARRLHSLLRLACRAFRATSSTSCTSITATCTLRHAASSAPLGQRLTLRAGDGGRHRGLRAHVPRKRRGGARPQRAVHSLQRRYEPVRAFTASQLRSLLTLLALRSPPFPPGCSTGFAARARTWTRTAFWRRCARRSTEARATPLCCSALP